MVTPEQLDNLGKSIGGIVAIGGALYTMWRYVVYPYVYMRIRNFCLLAYKVLVDASSIHEIVSKELKTNGGSSMKDVLKKIEGKLTTVEFFLLSYWDSVVTPMFLTNEAGDCVWVNKSYLRLVNRSLPEVLGDGWINSVEQHEREAVRNEWDLACQEARDFDMIYNISVDDKLVKVHCRSHGSPKTGYLGTIYQKM
jgi:PAS domain-containing protein